MSDKTRKQIQVAIIRITGGVLVALGIMWMASLFIIIFQPAMRPGGGGSPLGILIGVGLIGSGSLLLGLTPPTRRPPTEL